MKRMKPNATMVRSIINGEYGNFGPWFYIDNRTGLVRKRWWTKARIPGTIRASRLPGGSGFRNNWEADATAES